MVRLRPMKLLYVLAVAALVQTGISLFGSKGYGMTVWGDLSALALGILGTFLMARNAWRGKGTLRGFWGLWAFGSLLWVANQASWTWYEVVLRSPMPDPFLGDPVLFLHVVPCMAAVGLLAHTLDESRKLYFSTLNTVMLAILWVYVYMFVVLPDEYVTLHLKVYTHNYDILYAMENSLLSLVLLVAAIATRGDWRRLYLNLLGATTVYTLGSSALNLAISNQEYFTGSFYDLPYMVSLVWFVWTAAEAGKLNLQPQPADQITQRWIHLTLSTNMLAVLMLPAFGIWVLFRDPSSVELRQFRLLLTMVVMIVLGAFVMLRQHLAQRSMLQLLQAKQESYEHLEKLQDKLVQKEKLAALGHLLAGAAHEINNPLTTILGYSELLCSDGSLRQDVMQIATKINQQARRTRALVGDLLSFSQQSSTDRALANVPNLVERAVQIESMRVDGRNIRIEVEENPNVPRVWANINQLFQVFLEIVQNACEFMEETKGGVLRISFCVERRNLLIEFADSGPGIEEPHRVFDPFYTTKPTGRGTGLGLSAAYGIMQKHKGDLSCQNRPEGGASFIVSIPVASESAIGTTASRT